MHGLLVVLILSTGAVQVVDVPISTHNHTMLSDGEQTAKQVVDTAVAKGARFVVITDHLEMVDMGHSEIDFFSRHAIELIQWERKRVGLGAFQSMIAEAGFERAIPGGEAGLGPAVKVNNGKDHSLRFNHFGIIGGYAPMDLEPKGLYDQLIRLAEGEGATKDMLNAQVTLNKMIELSHAAGAIVVVHHPLDELYPALLGVGACDAVEFFNGGINITADTPFSQFYYLLAVSKVYNKAYGATAGGDWHGPIVGALASEREKARAIALGGLRYDQLDRLTIVRAQDESAPAVCTALRQGAYYGVCGNGRIKSMTAWPGEHIKSDTTLKVCFTGLNRLYGTSVIFGYVAAGGGPIRQKIVLLPLNAEPEVELNLTDLAKPEDTKGGYLYLLAANQLVTSAIYVDPKEVTPPPVAPSPPVPPTPPATLPAPSPQPPTLDDLLRQYDIQAEKVWGGSTNFADLGFTASALIASQADGIYHFILELPGAPLFHVAEKPHGPFGWDVTVRQRIRFGTEGQLAIDSIRVSPDGKNLMIRLWGADSRKRLLSQSFRQEMYLAPVR